MKIELDGHEVKIDDEDYERVISRKWRTIAYGYLVTGNKEHRIYLSHFILDVPSRQGIIIKYRDKNKYNNTRHNLIRSGRKRPPKNRTRETVWMKGVEERLKESRKTHDWFNRTKIKVVFKSGVRNPEKHELAKNDQQWMKHIHNSLERIWTRKRK
jgi:hypothetical protein